MTVITGLLLLAGGRARGQDVRASLGGNVTDPKGAVVPRATIVLTADEMGVVETTTTNASGDCVVTTRVSIAWKLV